MTQAVYDLPMYLKLNQVLIAFVFLIGLSSASPSLDAVASGDSANVTLSSGLHVHYPGVHMPAIAHLSSCKGGPIVLVASGTITGAPAAYSQSG